VVICGGDGMGSGNGLWEGGFGGLGRGEVAAVGK